MFWSWETWRLQCFNNVVTRNATNYVIRYVHTPIVFALILMITMQISVFSTFVSVSLYFT